MIQNIQNLKWETQFDFSSSDIQIVKYIYAY